MSSYVVKELETKEQLDQVAEVLWKAQFNPYMPSAGIFWPIFGPTPGDLAKAKQESKDRLWKEHSATSRLTHHWIFVEHIESKKIVAGCQWVWHDKSPFTDGIPKANMYWWPQGEAKEFCEHLVQQIMLPRCLWMHRKNAGLNMMAVLPEHRRRGIGGLMMEWAQKRIDEMGIEGFIEASPLGRELYERWGYRVIMRLDFYIPPNKPDIWNKLAHDLTMPAWYAMWRPASGTVQLGERNRPWQLCPQLHP